MNRLLLGVAALVIVIAGPAAAADVGLVFMHGKWGTNRSQSPIAPFVDAAKRAGGIIVEAPEMPWSRDRAYDKDIEGALKEVDAVVERLKQKGAVKIVVGGQSLGANMALAYGARRDGLAGILMVAPGHVPDSPRFRRDFEVDYQRALKMIAGGQGAKKERFADTNQGKVGSVGATAQDYVTWMAPDGAAVMPKNAAALKPGTPLMWVIGQDDGLLRQGEGYVYNRVPKHEKSVYKVVKGGHAQTPAVAASDIIAWIKSL